MGTKHKERKEGTEVERELTSPTRQRCIDPLVGSRRFVGRERRLGSIPAYTHTRKQTTEHVRSAMFDIESKKKRRESFAHLDEQTSDLLDGHLNSPLIVGLDEEGELGLGPGWRFFTGLVVDSSVGDGGSGHVDEF
jgi:hypothetical protein